MLKIFKRLSFWIGLMLIFISSTPIIYLRYLGVENITSLPFSISLTLSSFGFSLTAIIIGCLIELEDYKTYPDSIQSKEYFEGIKMDLFSNSFLYLVYIFLIVQIMGVF